MIEKIIVWIRMLKYSESSLDGLRHGKFYVIYADGERSRPMYYRVARRYSEIFGGTVFTDIKRKRVKVSGSKYYTKNNT